MSRSVKRGIVVDGTRYYWVLNANTIDSSSDTHIRVHKEGTTGNILYIDPYNWHFEIRPKFIASAIKFALDSGWEECSEGRVMYISYIDEQYQVLPNGTKFGYQLTKDTSV
ncbi:hypothetical protein ACJJIQ_10090 [Microbulbifer sp. ANSA003]|uniref:hypothetical protein n=1 Tax=unclassified Microbulbifer TaxID=2619833 RepID=UPI004039927B